MIRGSTFLERNFVLLVISVNLIVLLTVVVWPVFYVINASFFDIQVGAPREFVGLRNYNTIIHDKFFWEYLWHSVLYTIGSLSTSFVVSMILGICLNGIDKLKGFWRASILMPWAIPVAVSALIWRLILNDQIGIVNGLLLRLHILKQPQAWLGSPASAMISVILADSWTRIPLITILLLAGLQGIPNELYEAAKIDGAGGVSRFRYVTLPLMSSTITVTLIIVGIFIFRTYTLIGVLTSGGPGDSTQVFTTYIYQTGVVYLDIGYSSALSVVMFTIVILVSLSYRSSKSTS
jgi:multiple sugar transport system permease protein